MSYRALLTLTDTINSQSQDYRIVLDENFKRGEFFAELAGQEQTFEVAKASVLRPRSEAVFITPQIFNTPEERATYIEVYVDETWEVVWTRTDAHCHTVEITGKDCVGEMIFFRRGSFVVHDAGGEG